ncbi:MAG TPA: ABC transporter permease [Bryobacteraceae bacterium]|jgi:predicted permease
MNRFRKKLNALWRRRQLDRDLEDELRFHLEMAAEESGGGARRRFGNLTGIQERCRDLWTFARIETWWQDVRYAARTFGRNPGFTAVAVVALALGIGADTAMFTILSGAISWNAGLDHAERVIIVNSTDPARFQNFGASYPDFRDLQARVKSLSGLAAYQFVPVNVSDHSGLPERYYCVRMSANGNRVGRQKPLLGRDFTSADERPGAAPVVLLGHHVWQQRYGGDPGMVGRTIRVDDVPAEVVGVMPPGKRFPEETDLWMPLVPTAAMEKRSDRSLMVYGRLADGVKLGAARTELVTLMRQLASQYPETNRGLTAEVLPIAMITGVYAMRPLFAVLFGAVGFVLLIACADVANMLLARAAGRAREISIRVAIGAGRARIMRQLLIESTLLSLAGGGLGWLVAIGGLRWFDAGTGDVVKPVWLHLKLDATAFLYLAAISIATGVLFGMAPALRLAKVDIHGSLKDGGYGMAGGRRSLRLAGTLVAFEMALCVMLLAGAGLMIRSTANLYATPLGVNTANVLTMRINLPEAKYAHEEELVRFHETLAKRLDALPGVEAAAVVSNLPLGRWIEFPYQMEGDAPAGDRLPRLDAIVASAGYFRVGQVRARRGRLFTDEESTAEAPLTVVNENFAAKMWPGKDPLGKRLRLVRDGVPQPWLTVVGVVPDILQDFRHPLEHSPLIYLPYAEAPQRVAYLVARTGVPPSTLAQAFRTEVQRVDEALPVYEVRSLEDRIAENRLTTSLFGAICTVFAVVALVLASIGLYSVTAHSVSQRTQEFGIRLAMGGTSGDIVRLVFRQGLRPLAYGLMIGLPLAFGVTRLLRAVLAGVSPGDPVTFLAAGAVLTLAGVAGCAIPARRAVRVDPAVVLRCE